MNVLEYEKQFQNILDGGDKNYPYDSENYINYVKLNQARINRWYKRGKITPALMETVKNINEPSEWVLITEPWCGDAAHSHVFMTKIAELNPNISLSIQNRDAPNSEIDKYLTNGGKSIPILIVRNAAGKDLFTWGPRPKGAQEIVTKQKENTDLSSEDRKKELQRWYNKDKGASIQEELNELFISTVIQNETIILE